MPENNDGFAPSRDRISQGQRLADDLISGLQDSIITGSSNAPQWGEFYGQRLGRPSPSMTDVQRTLATMTEDFENYARLRNGIPCLVQAGGDMIPISISALSQIGEGRVRPRFEHYDYPRILAFALSKLRGQGYEVRFWQNLGALRDLLHSNLSNFLAVRSSVDDFEVQQPTAFAQASVAARLMTGSTPGTLAVSVTYNTSNMRIHSSPAYFLNWTYFGSSPSPVAGSLPPGLYKFAGDSPTKPNLIVDNGVFSIPANFTPTVIAF